VPRVLDGQIHGLDKMGGLDEIFGPKVGAMSHGQGLDTESGTSVLDPTSEGIAMVSGPTSGFSHQQGWRHH
jgi:hypothetical protein